jgi:hypothetical protein
MFEHSAKFDCLRSINGVHNLFSFYNLSTYMNAFK